jgi:DNA invertase Pin-like site-specific DNA recombinase
MASYRGVKTGAAASASAHGPASSAPARDATQASGGRFLKRAALYARVSTDKQEREETVASQVALLQQTAAAHGYEVLPGNVFIDDGISGTRLDRPALDRLRDLAVEGAFEVMLVTAPDRLARRYAYQVVLVEEFIRGGCEVVFVHQSLGASPEEQMLLQMQGVFAEYERALIQERTRRGRLFAARQGRVNWGNPPYGYTYVRKTPTTPQHKPRHDLLYASASFPRLDFSQSKLPLLRGHQWLTMLPYTTSCSVLSYMRGSDGQQRTGPLADCQCPPTR